MANRRIAQRLFLAEKMGKNYVSHVLAKLGLAQAAGLSARLHSQDKHRIGD